MKKETKKDKLRKWGLPERFQWQHLRYKSPYQKGVLWFFFSLFIRTRDVEKYGVCISCGKKISIDTCDAGHFAPASYCGRDLLFDETNVNAECKRCNAFDSMHLIGYARGLDSRYGTGTADRLYLAAKTRPIQRDWTAKEYEERIYLIKEKVEKLSTGIP